MKNHHLVGRLTAICLCLGLCAPVHSYCIPTPDVVRDTVGSSVPVYSADTVYSSEKTHFRVSILILPLSLVATGSFGVCNHSFGRLNSHVRDGMTSLRSGHYFHVDDYVQYLPVASYLGLGAIGIKCRHSFKERFAVGFTAALSMAVMVNGIKYAVKERRPDSDARNSFPSGHTATAFMGAELMRTEYGMGLGIASYAVAAGVAFLRLYNGRHWLNDVISGAGVGILSARIGYWMLPVCRRLFHWDKNKCITHMCLLPGYDYGTRTLSLGMAVIF